MKNNTAIANFNVTFGEKEDPLLSYFDEIILPAFNSSTKRIVGSGDKKDKYYFMNSRIVSVDDEKVFTGQLVKDTELEVKSKIVDEKLIEADEHYPAAPYSVFYIFLKNHRMILIRNQKGSPDLRSFRVTVNKIVSSYISNYNLSKEGGKKLPEANINIIGIPTVETWNNIFSRIQKVRGLELRFFPLNGDKKYSNLTSSLIEVFLKDTGAKQGTVKVGACKKPNGVRDIVSELDGVMEAKVTVDFPSRKGVEIKNNTIKEHQTIEVDEKGINNPNVIIPMAKKYDSIKKVSEENQKIYEEYCKKDNFDN